MNCPKEPLGHSQKKKLKNGDLVSWKNWQVIDKKLQTIINYGTILDIAVEEMGGREIYIADILCSKTGDTIRVNLLRLEKERTI
jgi:hypothetical protein